MKYELPDDCITDVALYELKKELNCLINIYEKDIRKDFKIYLYARSIKIIYNKHSYLITMVEIEGVIYWYIDHLFKTYFLINYNANMSIKKILTLLKLVNSKP